MIVLGSRRSPQNRVCVSVIQPRVATEMSFVRDLFVDGVRSLAHYSSGDTYHPICETACVSPLLFFAAVKIMGSEFGSQQREAAFFPFTSFALFPTLPLRQRPKVSTEVNP